MSAKRGWEPEPAARVWEEPRQLVYLQWWLEPHVLLQHAVGIGLLQMRDLRLLTSEDEGLKVGVVFSGP